jgi:hypothetical protein
MGTVGTTKQNMNLERVSLLPRERDEDHRLFTPPNDFFNTSVVCSDWAVLVRCQPVQFSPLWHNNSQMVLSTRVTDRGLFAFLPLDSDFVTTAQPIHLKLVTHI